VRAELDLSIVILSFNVSGLLKNCLASLREGQSEIRFETIVVDNKSDDDSVATVRRVFPLVSVIESQTNGGYA
jgi:N-acetylglucosaminyl-diphospho-decaprenol L-rhamnosyltransferase